jgi:tetratricopeptide (TPR) repeat protein
VDRALLLIDARDEVAQRFRMLASVQDIALEQLEASRELDAVRRRHAAYFTHLAEEADRRLQGSSSRKWLARLEADQQHLRAALRWGIDNDRSVALRLSSRLWMACIARSNFAEGRRWIDEVAGAVLPALEDLPPDDVRCLADALIGGAYLAYHQADYADAERRLRDARRVHELPGAGTWHGDDENLRGLIARRRCEFRKARRLIRSSVDISRTEGDMPSLADRLNTLGNVIREGGGDLHLADRRQQQSLAIHARLGDVRGGAMVQCDRAYIRLDREDYAKARRLLEESLEARIAVRDKQGEAQSLNGLGILEREEGRPEAAIDRHEQALEIFERIGDMLRVAETREALGLALILAGRAAEGREYLDQGEQVRDRLGAPRPPVLRTAV